MIIQLVWKSYLTLGGETCTYPLGLRCFSLTTIMNKVFLAVTEYIYCQESSLSCITPWMQHYASFFISHNVNNTPDHALCHGKHMCTIYIYIWCIAMLCISKVSCSCLMTFLYRSINIYVCRSNFVLKTVMLHWHKTLVTAVLKLFHHTTVH